MGTGLGFLRTSRDPRPGTETTAPGVVTDQNARAWLGEAVRGRAAQAWRKLRSWGCAPHTAEVRAQVEAKWTIQPQHTLPPWQIPRVEVLDALTSAARMARAQRHYQKTKASDALGWSPAVFRQLLGQPQGRKGLILALKAMWLHELSGLSLALSMVYRSIPLLKNGQGQVRPIAMPTMVRKLQATLTCLHFQEIISDHVGVTQFGTQKSGCARFGRWASLQKKRFVNHACVQLDLQDAFCSIDRRILHARLNEFSPDLASVRSCWLATPSFTVMPDEHGTSCLFQTTRGVAQGDPLSTMSFCVLMESVRRAWLAQAPEKFSLGCVH